MSEYLERDDEVRAQTWKVSSMAVLMASGEFRHANPWSAAKQPVKAVDDPFFRPRRRLRGPFPEIAMSPISLEAAAFQQGSVPVVSVLLRTIAAAAFGPSTVEHGHLISMSQGLGALTALVYRRLGLFSRDVSLIDASFAEPASLTSGDSGIGQVPKRMPVVYPSKQLVTMLSNGINGSRLADEHESVELEADEKGPSRASDDQAILTELHLLTKGRVKKADSELQASMCDELERLFALIAGTARAGKKTEALIAEGSQICRRSNMRLVRFCQFVRTNFRNSFTNLRKSSTSMFVGVARCAGRGGVWSIGVIAWS